MDNMEKPIQMKTSTIRAIIQEISAGRTISCESQSQRRIEFMEGRKPSVSSRLENQSNTCSPSAPTVSNKYPCRSSKA